MRPVNVLIIIAGLLKLLFVFTFHPPIHLWEEHDIAANFAANGEFFLMLEGAKNYAVQFPVYPAAVGIIYSIAGVNPLYVIVFNIILYTASAFLCVMLFSKLLRFINGNVETDSYSDKIITVSVLVFLLHPAINYYALCNVHPFISNTFFLLIALNTFFLFFAEPTAKNLFITGISTGLTILDRPTEIILLPFFLIMCFRFTSKNSAVKYFSILTITSFVVVLPWMIRNKIKQGLFVLTTNTERLLWKGSIINSEGSNYLADGRSFYSAITPDELTKLGRMTVVEQNEFYYNKWKQNVFEHPADQLRLYFVKLKNFWWFRELMGNELPASYSPYIIVYKISFVILLLLTFLSTIFFGKKALVILSVPILLSLFQSVFYVETRHRILIEPLLVFLAITTIFHLYQKFIPNLRSKKPVII